MTHPMIILSDWWAAQIAARTYGDPQLEPAAGRLAWFTFVNMQTDIAVTEAQLDRFRGFLLEELEPDSAQNCFVDYQPSAPLANAMKKAGIPTDVLGGKIRARIENGRVFVAVGYGAEYQEVKEEKAR